MNRETRDKFAKGTDQSDLTTGNACWQTPPLVWQAIEAEFGPFDLDLTADTARALRPIWFGPESPVGEFDALTAEWWRYGTSGYSNPPYGRFVPRMLGRAKLISQTHRFRSVLLLPVRMTRAFFDLIMDGASEVILCDGRITFFENDVPRLNEEKFVKENKLVGDPAMFDSMLVRYSGRCQTPSVRAWKVPPHVTKQDLERAAELRRSRDLVTV